MDFFTQKDDKLKAIEGEEVKSFNKSWFLLNDFIKISSLEAFDNCYKIFYF